MATTVDILLYLSETPEQTPIWWMEELYRPYGGSYSWTNGAALVDILDANGIDVGLAHGSDIRRTTFHPDHPLEHEVYVSNDYTAEQCALNPGRLYGVACVDALRDVPATVLELDRCFSELNFRAMKLLPTYHHHDPGNRALDPVYEKCIEYDIPIHTHTGWTPIINAPMKHARPVLLDELGIRYRELKMMVYLAFPYLDEGVAVVARHPNFYADLSYFAGGDPAALYDVLMKLKSLSALDRAVYGSDNNDKAKSGPGGVASQIFAAVNEIAAQRGTAPITAAKMDGIMGNTAAGLLKLDRPN